jgi:hypothetical protein
MYQVTKECVMLLAFDLLAERRGAVYLAAIEAHADR